MKRFFASTDLFNKALTHVFNDRFSENAELGTIEKIGRVWHVKMAGMEYKRTTRADALNLLLGKKKRKAKKIT